MSHIRNGSTPLNRASLLTLHCIAAIILFAGLSKLWHLPDFLGSLSTWSTLPSWLTPAIAVGIPVAEGLLGVLWFAGCRGLRVLSLIGVLLVLFTVAYSVQWIVSGPPECRCLGRILAFERSEEGAVATLARNGLLLFAYSVAVAARAMSSRDGRASVWSRPKRWVPCTLRSQGRGFTIVEVVIVIAIVTILIALAAPGLSELRQRVDDVTHSANLRSHGVIFSMYVSDWQDLYPNYVDAEATVTVLRAPGVVVPLNQYFGGYDFWHVALADGYLDGAWQSDALLPRSLGQELRTPYWYSASFVASPAFWNASTRTGPGQWRAVRSGEVAFPDRKGLLFVFSEMYNTGSHPDSARPTVGVAMADGSARRMDRGDFRRSYPGGEGTWPGSVFGRGLFVMHTIDGVRGRDVD